MKLAVVGSREFDDKERLFSILNKINEKHRIEYIVSGGAKGADEMSMEWCKEYGKPIKIFYPNWHPLVAGGQRVYFKGAGMKRNVQIVEEADFLIAFWDRESKGTKLSIDLCEEKKVKYHIYDFESKLSQDYVHAYVDGSFNEELNKTSWGLCITDKDKENELKSYSGIVDDEGASKHRQIVGELTASIRAVQWAKKNNQKVSIHYDYEGIYKWVSDFFKEDAKAWERNNEYSEKYRKFIEENKEHIFNFVKVKAHSSDKWNDKADYLAGACFR